MVWVVSSTSRQRYPREWDPLSILQEAAWVSEPVWTCAENVANAVFRFPDRPQQVAMPTTVYHLHVLRYALAIVTLLNV